MVKYIIPCMIASLIAISVYDAKTERDCTASNGRVRQEAVGHLTKIFIPDVRKLP